MSIYKDARLPQQTNPAGVDLIQNTNAFDYTDDNAQSVHLFAPILTSSVPVFDAFAFLNNVLTNLDAFYQVGIVAGNDGYGTRAATAYAYSIAGSPPYATDLGVPYYPGNEYYFTISYTNSYWWMCGEDVNIPNGVSYVCKTDAHTGVGNNLKADDDTSVWIEVVSQYSNWYTHFNSNIWSATKAKIYRNGFGQNWSYEFKWHAGCLNPSAPNPPTVISGNLSGGGTATWNTSQAHIQC